MGADSSIQWCDDTLNIWHGCQKVSDGCKHCYAEVSTPVRVKRAGGLELWGPLAARVETKNWEANLRSYAREAVKSGVRRRVFAQSLSDTFEDRRDLDGLRGRFFEAIDHLRAMTWNIHQESPLDLLLLTKRPENILRMVPRHWLRAWPSYVWIGCTVESQAMAEERIPHLLRAPAAVRFLSVEPQLEAVSLDGFFGLKPGNVWQECVCAEIHPSDRPCLTCDGRKSLGAASGISWVIQGGESGPKARPFDLAWARAMRDQCRAAGVAYFLKQLGARPILGSFIETVGGPLDFSYTFRDSHGGDESEWPRDLQGCRAFPVAR